MRNVESRIKRIGGGTNLSHEFRISIGYDYMLEDEIDIKKPEDDKIKWPKWRKQNRAEAFHAKKLKRIVFKKRSGILSRTQLWGTHLMYPQLPRAPASISPLISVKILIRLPVAHRFQKKKEGNNKMKL